MTCPPFAPDPRLAPFAPAAVREVLVFGAPATLQWVPGRAARHGRAVPGRPAFRTSPAARIVEQEAIWSDRDHVLTPNLYPFAREQRILWPKRLLRDPDVGMWTAIGAWADAAGGTALLNNIGAAATIARAHAHLVPERTGFLGGLREKAAPAGLQGLVELPPGVELVAKDVPFWLLGVRGEAAARAEVLVRLAEARLTPAWNVVVQDGTAWVYPRGLETPGEQFPYALGSAEVWGRWCFVEEGPFAAATGAGLERALVVAGVVV